MVNGKRIRASAGSRRGLHYVAASSHMFPNEGEIELEFMTPEGFCETWPFQIADVNKPLGSVADRVDNSCRVVYDKNEDTGEDQSYILHKPSGRIMKMRREGKVWKLDAAVAKDMLPAELFSRRG